jgi:hypothetical protein
VYKKRELYADIENVNEIAKNTLDITYKVFLNASWTHPRTIFYQVDFKTGIFCIYEGLIP